MKAFKLSAVLAVGALAGILAGCSNATANSPDVIGSVRKGLDEAGLQSVSASQDRRKGLVTLSGNVPSDEDKAKAGYVAGALASKQVVANQIAVVPPGEKNEAKAENLDLDRGIEMNLDAALRGARLRDDVNFQVHNHTVTLTGYVVAESNRTTAQTVAAGVPNVQQVVNELQIKRQKASSSN